MASIHRRENKNGLICYRVQIRRKGLKPFSITFPDEEQSIQFVQEFEEKYVLGQVSENDFDRLVQKRKNEFYKVIA